jgi:hypothetical protein
MTESLLFVASSINESPASMGAAGEAAMVAIRRKMTRAE